MSEGAPVRFGPFELRPTGELFKSGHRVRLHEQSVLVLEKLLARPGELVSRETLQKELWPEGTPVDVEHGLNTAVSRLRSALGDCAAKPRFVETVPRKGYAFIGKKERPAQERVVSPPRRQAVWGLAMMLFALPLAGSLLSTGFRGDRLEPTSRFSDAPPFRQITHRPGEELFPSLSPDGDFVVYASRESGNWDIYLQRVTGQRVINLTRDTATDDTQPSYSPDGTRIAFRSERDGGGIFVMEATGESVRRLAHFGYHPAWSPDGRSLLVSTARVDFPEDRASSSELWAVDVESLEKRLVWDGDAVQASWSPNGFRVAYWGLDGGRKGVWTIPAKGGTPLPVPSSSVDWNPVWAPDGKHLYFVSDRDGPVGLWRLPIGERTGSSSSEPEPISLPAVYAAHPSFSSDGRRLAFVSRIRRANIYRAAFDGSVLGDITPVTSGSQWAGHQDISPDGEWLTFVSRNTNGENISIVRRDGSGQRQLTVARGKNRYPRWSPDGTRIAFASGRGENSIDLWAIQRDGNGLQRLTHTTSFHEIFPSWSPDGSRIAYFAFGQGRGSSYIVDIDSGEREALPPLVLTRGVSSAQPHRADRTSMQWFLNDLGPAVFTAWSWSPDGRSLAGFVASRNSAAGGIVTYALDRQEYKQLTAFGNCPAWLRDARHLLFTHRGELFRLDTHSGDYDKVLSIGPDEVLPGVTRAPTEDGIYFTRSSPESDVWLHELRR